MKQLLFAALRTIKDDYVIADIRVIDGDTIEADVALGLGVMLAKQSIRLAGIDVPETHSADPVEKAAGMAVKNYVEQRIASGKKHEITQPQKDKYGRILAGVSIDNVSLNAELLDKKYARPYHGEGKTPWDKVTLQQIITSLNQ